MLKRGLGHTLLVLAALTIFAASAAADSRARIVRLSFVEGNVQMDQRDGRGLQKAFLNMPIGQGTVLLTRDEGRAEVEFENGSTIRIARDSQLEFQQLGLRTEGYKFSVINVTEGTAYFDVKKKNEDEFLLVVNGQQISTHKDARFRLHAGKEGANVAVFKGEIELESGGKQVAVRKNETIELDRSDASRYFLSREIITDPLDAWDLEREKYRDQYFAASAYPYNPSYSYGYADLAYWGTYEVVPVYGRVWRPYFVGLTWQPFADGSWVWYPGAGYVWVSAYPWGWAPYRYGSWVFVGSRGWCWRPAATYVSWVTVPVYYNAPVYFAPPRFPVDRRHHEPILVGNGGPGPVHPGDGGRGRWYRDDDPVRGGHVNGPDGRREAVNGPQSRPGSHDDPPAGNILNGKKGVFNGPDTRPMPTEEAGKGNAVLGKKEGFTGPDTRPAKREDIDSREDQSGRKQIFTGPDARPASHDNLANGNAQGGKKEVFTGPDTRPAKGNDLDARDDQGKKQIFAGPDARPASHDNLANGNEQGGKKEIFTGPDTRPAGHDGLDAREEASSRQTLGSPDSRPTTPASHSGIKHEVYSGPDAHPASRGPVVREDVGGRMAVTGPTSGGPSSSGSSYSAPAQSGPSIGVSGGPSSGPSGGVSTGSTSGGASGGVSMGSGGGHVSSGPSTTGGAGQHVSGGAATRGGSSGAGTHKH